MTIYEIDRAIEALLSVDEETGEVAFYADALESLQMARDAKVENLACAVKNLKAEAAAIKAEEESLATRRKSVEARAERAKEYLDYVLGGNPFKSAKAVVSYRNSTSCETDADFVEWCKEDPTRAELYLRYDEPKVNKKAVGDVLKVGTVLPFARLVTKRSISVK